LSIIIQGLKFRYAGSSSQALRGVDPRVEEGEIVTKMGRTGVREDNTLSLNEWDNPTLG